MDTLQVQTKVVNFAPPTWEGVQVVNGVEGTSYEVGLDLIPTSGVYPNTNPKLSVSNSLGGKYLTTAALTNEPVTTTLVPVVVTVTTDPKGGNLPPNFTIKVDLAY